MNTELSLATKIDSDLIKEILKGQTVTTYCELGIDTGDGDIQTIGKFKLLPARITKFKRKRKGKRYIILSYEISNECSFVMVGDEE